MATGRRVETDSRDKSDAPALQVHEISKPFFLPFQTYTLLSWATINRVVLIEEKNNNNKITKPENKNPSL